MLYARYSKQADGTWYELVCCNCGPVQYMWGVSKQTAMSTQTRVRCYTVYAGYKVMQQTEHDMQSNDSRYKRKLKIQEMRTMWARHTRHVDRRLLWRSQATPNVVRRDG